MLQNQIAQIFLRPKRLAAIEACVIGLISGLAAIALGESVGWLEGWQQQVTRIIPAYLSLPTIGLVAGLLAGWIRDICGERQWDNRR